MSRLTIDEIKKECAENELAFRRGKFKNGNKYRVSIFMDKQRLVWPCRTLKQCKEAITQAMFLREIEPA
jgi:hypothetical protein